MANFRVVEEDQLAKETPRMVRKIRVGITGPRNRTEKQVKGARKIKPNTYQTVSTEESGRH